MLLVSLKSDCSGLLGAVEPCASADLDRERECRLCSMFAVDVID